MHIYCWLGNTPVFSLQEGACDSCCHNFPSPPISQQWTALSNEANTILRMGCILRLGMWQPCRLSFQLSLFRQLPVCVRTWCLSIICL